MDAVLFQQAVHVIKIHPPYTGIITVQRAVHDAVAVGFQRVGKTDVGRAVYQHGVAGRSQAAEGGHQPTKDAVLVSDGFAR